MESNLDPDIRRILQFLEGYLTLGYPRTPDPDKDSKIMDPRNKDLAPDTLKLPGYPIRPRPSLVVKDTTVLSEKSCISNKWQP